MCVLRLGHEVLRVRKLGDCVASKYKQFSNHNTKHVYNNIMNANLVVTVFVRPKRHIYIHIYIFAH